MDTPSVEPKPAPSSSDRQSTTSRQTTPTPTWIKLLQFMATVAALVFLAFGAHAWSAIGRLKDYLQQPRAAVPAASKSAPSTAERPAAPAPKSQPAVGRPAPAVAAPRPAQPATSPVTRPGDTQARPERKPTPVKAATPARAVAPATTSTTPKISQRPVPEILHEPSESPTVVRQKYFERLMREGQELYQAGWYGPALGRFRRSASVMPRSAIAHLWVARAAIRVGRYEIARPALERTIALAPSSEAAREARVLLEQVRERG